MRKDLENKKILIVGAGGLLGSHLVELILSLGGKVIAADINISFMKKRFQSFEVNVDGSNLSLVEVDITLENDAKELFFRVGCLDGAVNCTYPRNANYGMEFSKVELSSFNENVSLHLGSAFLFMQQCVKYFKNRKESFSLVNLASIYGVVAPRFDIYDETDMTMPVEYAAIKSAIIHLTKYVSKYVSDSEFRINVVSPGGILDEQPSKFCLEYKKHTNGSGMLNVKDVLGAISFLLSDESKFINGQNIIIDDGFSL